MLNPLFAEINFPLMINQIRTALFTISQYDEMLDGRHARECRKSLSDFEKGGGENLYTILQTPQIEHICCS